MTEIREDLRRLLPAAYAVTIVFIITPIADIVTNVWPLEPGSVQWRFGFFGVTSNYLVAPMFGLLMLVVIAAIAEHTGMLLMGVVLSAVTGVLVLLSTLIYGLDVLQLRNAVRPEAEFAFRVGSAKSLFKLTATSIALLVLAIGGFRAWRALRPRLR